MAGSSTTSVCPDQHDMVFFFRKKGHKNVGGRILVLRHLLTNTKATDQHSAGTGTAGMHLNGLHDIVNLTGRLMRESRVGATSAGLAFLILYWSIYV